MKRNLNLFLEYPSGAGGGGGREGLQKWCSMVFPNSKEKAKGANHFQGACEKQPIRLAISRETKGVTRQGQRGR